MPLHAPAHVSRRDPGWSHRPTTSTHALRVFVGEHALCIDQGRRDDVVPGALLWRVSGSGVTPSRSWASAIRRVATSSATRTRPRGPRSSASARPRPRGRLHRPPAVSIVLTNGHETTSLRGIQAALGEEAHLVGGSASYANPLPASPSLPAAASQTRQGRPASLCSSAGPPRPSRPRSSPARGDPPAEPPTGAAPCHRRQNHGTGHEREGQRRRQDHRR